LTRGPVAVIGFGVTGRAVASYLVSVDRQVVVLDDHVDAELVSAGRALGLEIEPMPDGADAIASRLAAVEMMVPSPGVPVSHPVFTAAGRLDVPVRSEIELASIAAAIAQRPRLIAITGTNGKTTVTTLVAAILREAGIRASAAGNIGIPLIEAVARQSDIDVVVAEVSSFQLQFTETFRPDVSCWLNLAADHLDWHGTVEHYAAAKARIWANQDPGDTAVVNADDSEVLRWADAIPGGVERRTWSISHEADFTVRGGRLLGPEGKYIMDAAELPRMFPHDLSNSLAAAAVATASGAGLDACRAGLMAAPLLPHRVAFVGEAGGVSWYDDSKATTPASVLAALAGFESVVLIAGGRNKGLDLSALAGAVPPVRAVVGIGEAAPEVAAAFEGLVPVRTANSMEAAVDEAVRLSRPGDSVLLSPGCASFDWYRSYAARGDNFAAVVKTHLEKGGAKC
jgi:UDP-N-acetylmuramoylalanine--D-glutamate ligase